jgi:hypothetical protein
MKKNLLTALAAFAAFVLTAVSAEARTLRFGDNGPEVSKLQLSLIKEGHLKIKKPTGKYRRLTALAVQARDNAKVASQKVQKAPEPAKPTAIVQQEAAPKSSGIFGWFRSNKPEETRPLAFKTTGPITEEKVRVSHYDTEEGYWVKPKLNKRGKVIRKGYWVNTDYWTKVKQATSTLGNFSLQPAIPGRQIGTCAVDPAKHPLGTVFRFKWEGKEYVYRGVDEFHKGQVYAALHKLMRKMGIKGVTKVVDCFREPGQRIPVVSNVTVERYHGNFRSLSLAQRRALMRPETVGLRPSKRYAKQEKVPKQNLIAKR